MGHGHADQRTNPVIDYRCTQLIIHANSGDGKKRFIQLATQVTMCTLDNTFSCSRVETRLWMWAKRSIQFFILSEFPLLLHTHHPRHINSERTHVNHSVMRILDIWGGSWTVVVRAWLSVFDDENNRWKFTEREFSNKELCSSSGEWDREGKKGKSRLKGKEERRERGSRGETIEEKRLSRETTQGAH